jgi:hypothetical protein
MITQHELKESLTYDPVTGQFIWLAPSKFSNIKPGSIAGSLKHDGYVQVKVRGKRYYAHRLAWLYMSGEFPKNFIDHIDGNKANNSWINLREATNAQNQRNSKMNVKNTSGVKGVSWHKKSHKWQAHIGLEDGRNKNLGSFNSIEEAKKVVEEYRSKLHGEFANHG